MLAQLGDRLQDCIRPGDTLARVGGDESAVVLVGANQHEASAVAGRLLDCAARPIAVEAVGEVIIGASVGIALSTTPPSGVGELRRETDLALYTAKRNGRGQHAVSSAASHHAAGCVQVHPDDARAWYMRGLRADIATAKDAARSLRPAVPPSRCSALRSCCWPPSRSLAATRFWQQLYDLAIATP